MQFNDIIEYEEHYEQHHRAQCAICGRKYLNINCLDMHTEEAHSSLFKVKLEKCSSPLYRCYSHSCEEKFYSNDQRDKHCEEVHGIKDSGMVLEKRKVPEKDIDDFNRKFNKMKVSQSSTKQIPRAIIFGDEQKSPTFEIRLTRPRKNAAPQ